jgi:hypothetical protein
MGRDAIRLIAEGVAHQHGWRGARLNVSRGGVTTFSFVFAHEPARMTARRIGDCEGLGHEVWECSVHGNTQHAVRFEFKFFAREARASEAPQSENRDLLPLGMVTGEASAA